MALFPQQLTDRYQRFKFRHFEQNREHYVELATFGQNPEVMIVSCCDSRCDPETIFSAMPGEIFVVRNVANLVPPFETAGKFHGVSAALEFAALNLRVKYIIVMGHSSCGGIKAALEHSSARQTEDMFISKWMSILDESRIRVLGANHATSPTKLAEAFEKDAIKTSLANLRSFPFIADLEKRGKVSLYGAYYDIAKGSLEVLNPASDEYQAL
jgi:carbonic anhydrase